MEATGGKCDALFNNGGYGQVGAVEDLPVDALRAQFESNFFGYHDLTRRVIPVMRKQGQGRIVQCSSILGLVPMRFRGAYNASKHALEGLSVTLALGVGRVRHSCQPLSSPAPLSASSGANALRQFHRTIGHREIGGHRNDYTDTACARLEEARKCRTGCQSLGPEAVYRVLHHAR